MSKIVVGVGCALIVAAGAAVWIQHEDNDALRAEIALLRDEVHEAGRAKTNAPQPVRLSAAAATINGLSTANASDLASLRDEIAGLRKNTQQVVEFVQMAQAVNALKEMSGAAAGTPDKLTAAADLKNLGKATPDTAMQTTLWAAVGGDVDALAGSFTFTPAGRAKADAWFAGLSDSTRQQYGSPEKVIALMVAKDAAGISGMQVLGQKEITANDVGVRVRFASNDGQTKDDNVVMHRVDDGWRMLLSDTTVQKFANKLDGRH